ncbi:MAG TPA: mechanosensitive ion channel family protein [Candidatus Pygmaiobacter gallistercoris]|nr:mechanosensitive ion channel family protein [Candidatus Pygmaiobacter gallistercoris]
MENPVALLFTFLRDSWLWQWIWCVLLFLLFLLLSLLYRYKAVAVILKLAKKLRGSSWEDLLRALSRPISALLLTIGITLALWYLPLSAETMVSLRLFLSRALRLVCLWLICWAGFAIVDNVPVFQFRFLGSAEAVRRMLRRTIKVLFVAFAVLAALETLGFPVGSLIAGLGLGGLTLSLAAKDTASNLFSGLVLLVERPFAIGDWVSCAGVEGTVEDITFRSTKIRTLANTLTIIPNSLVSAGFISNGSERKMRMAEFTLGVCYDTPRAALEQLLGDLRSLLTGRDSIVPDTVVVRLTAFSASSIDIFVRYYTRTTNYNEYLEICESLNLEILSLMEKDGVQFAFPSTTVYFGDQPAEQPPKH